MEIAIAIFVVLAILVIGWAVARGKREVQSKKQREHAREMYARDVMSDRDE